MNKKIIQDLNNLNTKFYQAVADSFSDSRNSAWQGWEKLIPQLSSLFISHKSPKVLDLGCGNARFAEFLIQKFPKLKINYFGLDSNADLLKIAEEKLINHNSCIRSQFQQVDLVSELLNDNFKNRLKSENYDLVVAFGLMHHLPSFEIRVKLLKLLADLLPKNSYLIIAFWQFHKSERLMRKVVNPGLVKINKKELEKNDFILDWQRGKTAHRYCHSFTDEEIEKLVEESGLQLASSFNADGKENLNRYAVLRK
ncbi:MAG: class I SAM-dependent methyltransferase [Patescibacteria group bacterium]